MINQVKNLHKKMPLQYVVVPLCLCLVLLASPWLIWKLNVIQKKLQLNYQTAQVDHANSQRYLELLSGALFVEIDASDSGRSFDVSLREAAIVLQGMRGVQLDEFTVIESDPIEVDDELELPMTALQVNFEATLHHAPALLNILAHLVEISSWRVLEVRGCAMQRLLAESGLAAACSLEIYSWTWLGKSLTGETNDEG